MKKTLAFISIFCFVLFVSAIGKPAPNFHPYHVGSVEFKYNNFTKTFQISGKFFLDDMENALKKKFGQAVHFDDERYRNQINSYLIKYCEENLKLKSENRLLKINYLGYEEDSESVNIYLESQMVNTPQKVEAGVSMLYNLFDDQMNIIHIIVGGKRKSDRLMYPDRNLQKEFNL